MRITELILDGFKSYPHRTSISGWDGSFNAVTGLNGSGKSNILDSICFVLGITNLGVVRAQNLVDLIYKRGQAGVSRASVTIVFDNSDKTQSPVGYEDYSEITVTRQIALNGTSKYIVCGHRATQQAVQNLFQSVQLNINNPNFVIMQGKITKVLNMRPQEILSMIEEAAGTSMFEEKKEKAVKTMAKKEKRLEEIQSLLAEEITPKLDRLREEKRAFVEYQKITSELERLSRLIVAWDWIQLQKRQARNETQLVEHEDSIKEAKAAKKRMEGEVESMQKEMLEITKRRDKELAKGGKVALLEQQQKDMSNQIAKLKAQVEIIQGTIADEESHIKELEKAAKEATKARDAKQAERKKVDERFGKLKETSDTASNSLKTNEELLQTLMTGISSSSDDGAASGFMGQLTTAQSAAATAKMEGERAKADISHLQKELKEKEPKAKKAASDSKGLLGELESARKSRDKLDATLKSMDWDEAKESSLRDRKDVESKAVRQLLEKRDAVKSKLAVLDFDYADPVRGFDRSQVKGLVASLVSVSQEHFTAATALEVCAGGRLYNVVVENEVVGSQLLDKGQLRKRVTMIPLNKINAFVASAKTLDAVKKVSKDRAHLALTLVGYEDEVSAAMAYVFGNTLIAQDSEVANAVTFNKDIRMKSVTLDGDIYDPSGTLSGGSKPKTAGILIKVQELQKIELELRQRRANLDAIEKEWEAAKDQVQRYKQAKKDFDLKAHEVRLLEERVKESSATRVIGEVEQIKATIEERKAEVEQAKERQKTAETEAKRIEKEMSEFKNNRGKKLDELKATIAKQKTAVQKGTAEMKNMQREVQTHSLELEQLEKDIATGGVELAEARTGVAKTKEQLGSTQAQVETLSGELSDLEAKIAEETKMLTAFKEELDSLDRAIKKKNEKMAESDVKVKELDHSIAENRKDSKLVVDAITKLEKEYVWVAEESVSFGKEGTPYDFDGMNMSDAKRHCQRLQESKQGMKKKVNEKVLTMIDNVEKKERDLLVMHKQVVKDKQKIEETVAKLDDYKRDALHTTWEKVNAEFGPIFADLLPGNFAKLQPPEGMEITDGLEVKVRLGPVWKASLTELSGGQRSLIALSLIMSLLRFKPAPMYLLDEVDAALDMSHTENMGRLFKTRFKGSQFIVISLKDGMFANANVLFRTRFRDGSSVVERTAQRSASNLYDADKENARARGKGAAQRQSLGRAPMAPRQVQ